MVAVIPTITNEVRFVIERFLIDNDKQLIISEKVRIRELIRQHHEKNPDDENEYLVLLWKEGDKIGIGTMAFSQPLNASPDQTLP